MVGGFDSVGGKPRTGAALVDRSTAAPTGFDPDVGGSFVVGAVSANDVLLGGFEVTGGGVSRPTLAALDPYGHPTSFAPQIDGNVNALVLSPDRKTLYIGGNFTTVNGQPRANLAAFDAATGALEPWQSGVGVPPHSGRPLRMAAPARRWRRWQ